MQRAGPRRPLPQRRPPAPRRLQLIAAVGSIVFSLSFTGLIYMLGRSRDTFSVSGALRRCHGSSTCKVRRALLPLPSLLPSQPPRCEAGAPLVYPYPTPFCTQMLRAATTTTGAWVRRRRRPAFRDPPCGGTRRSSAVAAWARRRCSWFWGWTSTPSTPGGACSHAGWVGGLVQRRVACFASKGAGLRAGAARCLCPPTVAPHCTGTVPARSFLQSVDL